jgi:hypothetical protein
MKTRALTALAPAGLVLGVALCLASCAERASGVRPPLQQGWVPQDRIDACLAPMMTAPMPVHYHMPVDEAVTILGPPHGELRETLVLRKFPRTEGARAYYWHRRDATLYVVYDRRSRLVENMIVADDTTDMGVEILLTRREILSARVALDMNVTEVYRIMGKPDRIDQSTARDGRAVDRFWYDSDGPMTPGVFIEIDRATFEVTYVSTALQEETGPPPDLE